MNAAPIGQLEAALPNPEESNTVANNPTVTEPAPVPEATQATPNENTGDQGEITTNPGNPAVTDHSQTESSDSVPSTTDPSVLLQQALESGIATAVDEQVLLDAAVAEAQSQVSACENTLAGIFPDGPKQATFPYLSNHVYSSDSSNYPLHVAADSGATYAWVGERDSGTRFAYFGAGIFTLSDSHYWGNLGEQLADSTQAVLNWLINPNSAVASASSATPIRVVALNLRAKQQFDTWIQSLGIESNWISSATIDTAAVQEYDLVIGLAGGELTAIEPALEAGKPILLWSEVFNPGGGIHKLGLRWNWWGEQTVGTSGSVDEQCALAFAPTDLLQTLESLQLDQLNFEINESNCPTHIYTRQCRASDMLRADGRSLQEAVLSGIEDLRARLSQMDAEQRNVFDPTEHDRLLKLAVLLGDKFRTAITYPMDAQQTPPARFYRALFADYANHYARPNNLPQLDNGDFSPNTGAIAAMPGADAVAQLHPTSFSDWNSTGLTARAGKAVTLTREDSNPRTVSVRFNMLRSQSTKIWNHNGYTRPLFTSSHVMVLPAGESITMSSPIGGPMYIHWDGDNQATVEDSSDTAFAIRVSGAVKHPLLNEFSNEKVQQFAQALAEQPFDWVDIKTPFAEVHSRRDFLLTSFDRQTAETANSHTVEDVQQWVSSLNSHLIESALTLAGFIDSALPEPLDTSSFCQARDLDCTDEQLHRKPALQHIVSDLRASCGDLCSGNPFDTNSPVDPLGFGEAHEMGHNLQRSRLNFHGARSLESSNNIFPHYAAWRWLNDQGLEQHHQIRLPDPEKTYQQLQQSVLFASEPGIGHPIWSDAQIYVNADVRLMLYLQLVYIHHQWENNVTADSTGWNLYTKLYKLEREFTRALNSDGTWNSERDKLGFSTFNRNDAMSISGNDFMAIALSLIANRDHRAYLSIWGIDISGNAAAQIDVNGYIDSVDLVYWKTPADRYVRTAFPSDDPTNALPLDGLTTW